MPDLAALTNTLSHAALHSLRPRAFEDLVYHYIRDRYPDCRVAMTKRTRDGGFDLVCIDSANGPFIVEAKKYTRTRLSVSVVRELAGVQLINQIPSSIIVTTGRPTHEALREQQRLNNTTSYKLSIHDIQDVLSWLDKRLTSEVRIDLRRVIGDHYLANTPVRYVVYDPASGKLEFT
ncbi:MAG: restriction endonuclease [Planctomycetota bacterium]